MKCVIAIVAALVLTTCHTPRQHATSPDSTRFVSFNIYKCQRGEGAVVAQIREKNPAVACLQEVRVEDHDKLAERLGMYHVFKNHRNYPNEGVAIYSRTPLTNVKPMIDPDGRTCALFADTSIAGRRVTIASVHLVATQHLRDVNRSDRMRGTEIALIKQAWKDHGGGPIIIAGDFNQIPMGGNYKAMRDGLTDALATLKQTDNTLGDGILRARVDYFLIDPKSWRPISGGTGAPGASDHLLIWMDAEATP